MKKTFSLGQHAILTAVWMIVALYMIFLYAPTEVTMGEVQRIFYFHAPAGITAFVSYFVVAAGGVMYLAKRQLVWDELSHGAAELGLVFCSCNLVTGPLTTPRSGLLETSLQSIAWLSMAIGLALGRWSGRRAVLWARRVLAGLAIAVVARAY